MGASFGELAGHDAYEVLGVDPSAPHEQIRRAYRELAKAGHPDLFSGQEEKEVAEERLRLLNAAYAILESRRAAYDAFRGAAEEEPGEIVEDPWGGAEPGTADPWGEAEAGTADPWGEAAAGAPSSPEGGARPMPPPPPYRQASRTSFMRWGPEEHQHGLLSAGELFRHVVTGGDLDPITPPVILGPGEAAHADLSLEYSRFYGMDVTYRQRSVAPIGSAAFVVGALAVTAVGNAAARKRARAQAAPQWRERQIAGVLLTSQRLSIGTQGGRLSFWHQGLAEFLPAPDAFALELVFHDAAPVRLRGPGAPWLSVAMARLLYPSSQLLRIPGFAGMTAWFTAAGQRSTPPGG